MHPITNLNYRYLLLSPRRWILRLLMISLAYFAFEQLMEIRSTSGTSLSLKNALHFSKRESVSTEGGRIKRGDWCTEAEYLDGEWSKREEEVTLARLREIYQYTDEGQFKCMARDLPRGSEPPEGHPDHYVRILETAQYEWKPKSECRKHEWDAWNFAKFCLRSRGGCSLVGDSLADQIYRAVYYTMATKHDSLFDINRSIDRVYNITVNRNHPLAPRLAREAGVSEERFERPVFNYWREHHLLHRHELDEVFKGVWHYEPWVNGPSFFQNGWIHDRSWWFELWTDLLAKPIRFVEGADGSMPIEETSTISFNSAPHWTAIELWPSHTFRLVKNEDLLRGWIGAFTRVLEKVTAASKEHDVLAWWRSTVPGHPECWQYRAPENNRTNHLSTQNPSADHFNWNLYPVMDQYASSRLGYNPSESNQYLRPIRFAMRYLDLWSISVKRPDAHLNPAIDCSHYCLAGVPQEWLGLLWHLTVSSARNHDYDEPSSISKWH